MSEIHLRHIQRTLQDSFVPHVDISDYDRGKRTAPEHAVLSRALAAYALKIRADLTPEQACKHVVDGFGDNGIDAIYHDEEAHCVYLVQSKWVKTGGLEVAEVSKFVQGARDLLSVRFERFNERFRTHGVTLKRALDNPETRFEMIIATISSQPASDECKRLIEAFLGSINDVGEIVTWHHLGQADLYRSVAKSFAAHPIDLDVMLFEWGQVQTPFKAFYGQVSVLDIAKWWQDHRHQLFSKNLRSFLGDSAVNDAIAETLLASPDRFWYLNNGITILCSEIAKKPMGGESRATGVFVCRGVAIVNGAQTVGTIGRTAGARQHDGKREPEARAMVRLISLADAQTEFAGVVTRATNTQNRIDPRDFAALDEEQQRLKMELSIEGVLYVYRSGEPSPTETQGCTIEEATVALACAADDSQLAVHAKGSIGKLWADIGKPPYKILFNRGTTGEYLWRCVQILRRVENTLDEVREHGVDLRRQLAVHGNRFVARQVFRTLRRTGEHDAADVEGLAFAVLDRLERSQTRVLESYYVPTIFKTPSKCDELERELFADLGASVNPVPLVERRRRMKERDHRQLSLFGDRL